jgi:alpha-beta hydrolase superfamily lysophospholipase
MAPIFGRLAPKLFIKSEFDGDLLSTDPDVGEKYINDPLRIKGATAGLGHGLFTAMKEANDRLDRLSVPTMVVHGVGDRIVPAHFTEPLGALPNATREALPGLEHEVLNEPSWETTLASMIDFANAAIADA